MKPIIDAIDKIRKLSSDGLREYADECERLEVPRLGDIMEGRRQVYMELDIILSKLPREYYSEKAKDS